jgi:hypothetical protein
MILLSTILFSCKEEPLNEQFYKDINFNNKNIKINTSEKDLNFGIYVFNEEDNLQYSRGIIEDANFSKITKYLVENFSDKILNIHLYINEKINVIEKIEKSNIIGISVFYDFNGEIIHELLINEDNIFKSKNILKSKTNTISTNNIDLIAKIILKEKGFDVGSVLAFTTLNKIKSTSEKFDKKWDDFTLNVFKEVELILKSKTANKLLSFVGTENGTTTCGNPCLSGNDQQVCKALHPTDPEECREIGGHVCGCSDNKNDLIGHPGNMSLDSINDAHEPTLLYDYRDSILNKTFWGLKNKTYYYYLSDFLKNEVTVPISLRVETAKVLLDYRPQIAKLINFSAYYNDTLLGNSLANKMTSLFQDYKELSSDTTYNFVLDNIINDINFYKFYNIENFINHTISQTTYVSQ